MHSRNNGEPHGGVHSGRAERVMFQKRGFCMSHTKEKRRQVVIEQLKISLKRDPTEQEIKDKMKGREVRSSRSSPMATSKR